ncbi:MAG: DUF3160 domain-containing protein [Herbinix sp.]|nr:DUF3160 domain-containing protein [Herbinix sp.]
MKKFCAIILCICMTLTGCHSKTVEKDNNNTVGNNISPTTSEANKNTSEDNTATIGTKLLTLSNEWSLVKSLDAIQSDYQAPAYEAKVPAYTIAKDLSNIENIDQFSGFTKEQINMLVKNGFFVSPSIDTRIYYVYDDNEYKGVPNFITADAALHLYHQFYDKSLMSVETGYLYNDLDLMTKQMLDKSLLLLEELKDEDLKSLQEKNVIYFMVARMLFTQTSDIAVEADQKLIDVAKQEFEICQVAEGYQKSPLLGTDFDYSQCKVRGHYTRSEELGKFFKTMMWLGTASFDFANKDNILQSLLITFTTFSDSENTCDAKLWSDIYQPTTQYVGLSDDINVFDMNSLRLEVYGNSDDPNIFNDEVYQDKLEKAVKALPEPQIKASLSNLSTPTGKQFRFMGQRYILDSDILQKLIDNDLRPIPSSLDVMGVLGSNVAEDLLFNEYKPQETWPKYTENYNKLKNKAAAFSTDYWKTNLYSGWLWSLQEVLTKQDLSSGMPFFMTTKAWKYKSLNTALGSYTELKHDCVLYGKQASAEGGGPEAFADQHYVEPNVNLYSKLLYLTDFTVSILEEKGMMNTSLSEGASQYKDFLNLLMECSLKELNNEALTEEEKKQLLWSGGTMESIMTKFLLGVTGDYSTNDVTDMLATDIMTYMGTYLSLGTGYFDHIYVVIPVGGKLYLSRGSVYSFYEFTSDTRLTDEEWWALQGITINHSDYGDYPELGEPSASLPKQPSWIKFFKTDSNRVMIKALDVDWDNMSE